MEKPSGNYAIAYANGYVDPGGSDGHPTYMGIQCVNDWNFGRRSPRPSTDKTNIRIMDDMKVYADKEIKQGEELFWNYGVKQY